MPVVIGLAVSFLEASSRGGGLSVSGGSARVSHTTLAYNISDDAGGGIWNSDASSLRLVNATIVGNVDFTNDTTAAGGIRNDGSLTLYNSVVAQNRVRDTIEVNQNVVSTTSFTSVNNFTVGDPRLGPLSNNCGSTLTMLPLSDSRLLDAGDNSFAQQLPTDQRGLSRLVDGNNDNTPTIDIGATEYNPGPDVPYVTGADAG